MHRCSNCSSLFSDEGRRDEHQWLCSWRQSNRVSFTCHCCDRDFAVEEERNKHEFYCSSKMPPGFSFKCKFCSCRISHYTHSSFLYHEKHCSLNPDVRSAQRIFHQYRGGEVGVVVGNNSTQKHKVDSTPFCVCPVDRDKCVVSMGQSSGRPFRKYYCCSKGNEADRCNYFEWCD